MMTAQAAALMPRPRTNRRRTMIVAAPHEAARDAKLRYVDQARPGITRKHSGKHWSYATPEGAPLREPAELDRIRNLAIPPAWTDVWISTDAQGHIQATGRDARGRKQYRYHPRWHEVRDETKFGRMVEFGHALSRIRECTQAHLAMPGLPREKVLATIVQLLESTLIRIGNGEYARQNDSFGLTTLRDDHADITGASIKFRFRGKSGKEHVIGLRDRRLARIVRRCQELPGENLFQYVNGDGLPHTITSSDVNEYIREISGDEFTAKDFRTWAATVLAFMALRRMAPAEGAAEIKHNVVRAVEEVASALRNTKAVSRKSYIHPAVIEAYESGALAHVQAPAAGRGNLAAAEIAVLALLEQSAKAN